MAVERSERELGGIALRSGSGAPASTGQGEDPRARQQGRSALRHSHGGQAASAASPGAPEPPGATLLALGPVAPVDSP